MKAAALAKAREHLALARKHVAALRKADRTSRIVKEWGGFLTEAGRFYSKLETGSKQHGQSDGWFGRKKNERKTDPLLRYVHHARNSHEHSIEEITGGVPGSISMEASMPSGMMLNGSLTIKDGKVTENTLKGDTVYGNPKLVVTPPRVILVRIYDRQFGDHFDTPHDHLGVALEGTSPVIVAELAVDYMETMLAEAEALPEH